VGAFQKTESIFQSILNLFFVSFLQYPSGFHRKKISAGIYFMASKACGQGLYPTLKYLSSSQYLHRKEGEVGVAHLVEKH
jgi:hypothetical protein